MISLEECKPYGTELYDCKVDLWKNRFNGNEPYKVLPGDVFILADVKPEVASDLERMGKSWTFAIVHKISEDENEGDLTSTSFKVKAVVKNSEIIKKSMFVVFLLNILPSKRIWNALHMDGDSQIMKEVLCPNLMVSDFCSY